MQGAVYQRHKAGKVQNCLNVEVRLPSGQIDEQHDLLYIVRQGFNEAYPLPRTYKELCIDYIVRLNVIDSVGQGTITVSSLSEGRYKLYFLTPETPQTKIKSANARLKKIGEGKELNIWFQSHDESLKMSICSEDVRAQNSIELK